MTSEGRFWIVKYHKNAIRKRFGLKTKKTRILMKYVDRFLATSAKVIIDSFSDEQDNFPALQDNVL